MFMKHNKNNTQFLNWDTFAIRGNFSIQSQGVSVYKLLVVFVLIHAVKIWKNSNSISTFHESQQKQQPVDKLRHLYLSFTIR